MNAPANPAPAAPADTTPAGAGAPPAAPAAPAVPPTPPVTDPPTGDPPAPPSAPKPGDDPPAGDTPADDPPGDGSDAVPETYAAPDLPDGIAFDESLSESLTPILREAKITQGQFDKLATAVGEHQARQWQAIEGGWLQGLQQDAELNANDGALKKAAVAGFAKFGTPEAAEAMKQLRWGNHPELVRVIGRLSQAAGVVEDPGTDSAASGGGARTFADRMYPNMAQGK